MKLVCLYSFDTRGGDHLLKPLLKPGVTGVCEIPLAFRGTLISASLLNNTEITIVSSTALL